MYGLNRKLVNLIQISWLLYWKFGQGKFQHKKDRVENKDKEKYMGYKKSYADIVIGEKTRGGHYVRNGKVQCK